MEELKPCPFCGREAADFFWKRDPFEETVMIAVECNACGARTESFQATGDPISDNAEEFWEQRAAYRALDAWNRRAENG